MYTHYQGLYKCLYVLLLSLFWQCGGKQTRYLQCIDYTALLLVAEAENTKYLTKIK